MLPDINIYTSNPIGYWVFVIDRHPEEGILYLYEDILMLFFRPDEGGIFGPLKHVGYSLNHPCDFYWNKVMSWTFTQSRPTKGSIYENYYQGPRAGVMHVIIGSKTVLQDERFLERDETRNAFIIYVQTTAYSITISDFKFSTNFVETLHKTCLQKVIDN